MRRELPPRANLEHLKKQAKDLLDDHKRADPAALARIREAVPAFAGMDDAAIARAPFALHDAQSAIAREYGTKSWNELREAVAAQSAAAAGPSDDLLRALMPLPFPGEVGVAMREVTTRRGEALAAAERPLAGSLPLLAMRNALFVPRAIGPIHVARPQTLAALDAATARTPATVAVFAQRAPEREDVDAASLHPIGCEALVQARIPDGADRAWVVLEGVRWIALGAIEPGPRGSLAARVSEVRVDPGDAAEVAGLAAPLRARMRDLASAFPDSARLVALVDAAEPAQLADLLIANLPASVDDKARYAAELRLAERLRIATALVGRSP